MAITSSFGFEKIKDYNTSGAKLRMDGGSIVIDDPIGTVVIQFAIDSPHSGSGCEIWHQNSTLRYGDNKRPKRVEINFFKEDWDHIPLGIGSFNP